MNIFNYFNMGVTAILGLYFINKGTDYLIQRKEIMQVKNREFAEVLKKLRNEIGFTQKQVAKQMGISQQNYAKWESGKYTPSVYTLVRLADYFVVSTDYLLGRKNERN